MSVSVILFLILGLVLLVAGADLLVRGASRLALRFGISPLVIGLTVVAFGISNVRSNYRGRGLKYPHAHTRRFLRFIQQQGERP